MYRQHIWDRGAAFANSFRMAINDYRVAVGCRDNPDVILDFVGRSVIDAGDIALAESFGEDWLTQVCEGRLFVSDLHRVVGDQSNALNAGSIEFQPPVFSQLWIGDLEAKTAAEINVARAIIGLQSLAVDPTMSNFAREHSLVMARAGSIFHSTGNPFGENVLLMPVGFTTATYLGVPVSKAGVGSSSKLAEEAVEVWMGSPGHRANISDARYTLTGLGVAVEDSNEGNGQLIYFTQNFK